MLTQFKKFTRHILLILLYLFLQTNTPIFTQELTKTDAAEILEESKNLLKDKDNLLKEMDSVFQEYNPEVIQEILNEDKTRLEKLREFNNTVVFEIPFPKITISAIEPERGKPLELEPKIGIYNSDLIKIPLWALDILVDWFLQQTTKTHQLDYIFEKINEDPDTLINLLEKFEISSLAHSLSIQDKTKTKNATQEKEALKKIQETEKELATYLEKTHCLPYSSIIKNFLTRKTFIYPIYLQISKLLKERWLGPNNVTSFHGINQIACDSHFYTLGMLFSNKPVPAYNLLKLFTGMKSRPLTTSAGLVTNAFDFLTEPLKSYQTSSGEVKRYLIFKIMESDAVFALKEIIILIHSIKLLNKNLYIAKWINHLKNNRPEFIELLKKYKSLKKKNISAITQKELHQELLNAENALKKFIQNGTNVNFKEWLEYKNSYFARSQFLLNLITYIPSYVAGINWIYDQYKNGKLQDMLKQSKMFFKDPFIQFTIPILIMTGAVLMTGLLVEPSY